MFDLSPFDPERLVLLLRLYNALANTIRGGAFVARKIRDRALKRSRQDLRHFRR